MVNKTENELDAGLDKIKFFQWRTHKLLNTLSQLDESNPEYWMVLGRLRECGEIGKRMKNDNWGQNSFRKTIYNTPFKRRRLTKFDHCTHHHAKKVRTADLVKASKTIAPVPIESIEWLFHNEVERG